jgi:hypothetical protein
VSCEIILVPEVHDWYLALDEISASLVRTRSNYPPSTAPRSATSRRTESPAIWTRSAQATLSAPQQ